MVLWVLLFGPFIACGLETGCLLCYAGVVNCGVGFRDQEEGCLSNYKLRHTRLVEETTHNKPLRMESCNAMSKWMMESELNAYIF